MLLWINFSAGAFFIQLQQLMKKTDYIKTGLGVILLASVGTLAGQQPVAVGSGSYAEYTPLSKSKTDEHGGDKSRFMETRKIYMTERRQGDPVPTNDWWTNLLVDIYSGVLWTYPQVVKAEGYGIFVSRPNQWSSDGCEMKYETKLTVKGRRFRPADAKADDWSDWGLRMQLADGDKRMNVTMAQGVPFTWVEAENLDLLLNFGGGELLQGEMPLELPAETDRLTVRIGEDLYGVYAPDGTLFSVEGDDVAVTFPQGKPHYLSIAVLPDVSAADFFARYAAVVPRKTTVGWQYDERGGVMTSTWHIDSENLDGEAETNVLQGFMPHHYKSYSTTNIAFLDYSYATPRGKMRLAAGRDFTTAYRFSGMLPWFAAPKEMDGLANPYNRGRMKQMLSDYAAKGSFGADTYWGGKGLIQMALNMTFAKEMGETELFEQCRSRLRDVMENWLTYTPGEQSYFFARYNRWGALVGYDTSYDSDTFNDHHFHYGYFTYAGALLALCDDDFRAKYGDMLRLIVKDYANWDRNDKRFPLFRTFCPWSGHSYAGGLGNTGNGNGQESTSEAMQGWGGMYLLGVALGDKEMRDAAIFGWVTESKGVAEYWFDRDRENINRDLYKKPYNSNLTAAGIGWWTWFSGDPVWMHSIQWMPISPCLDYLSEDLAFAKWDYEQMWAGKEISGWETDPNFAGAALSKESGLGNVVLSYLQRFDPDQAAKVFDEMWEAGTNVARSTDTNGITYFVTHSHRTYGDRDFGIHADLPTSSAFRDAAGVYTYVVYNPESTERTVTFSRGETKVESFVAPARRLTVYRDEPSIASVKISAPEFRTVEPGASLSLEAVALDQYGATMPDKSIEWKVAGEGGTISAEGVFLAGSQETERCEVTASCEGKKDVFVLRIGPKPVVAKAGIVPETGYAMVGQTVVFSLELSDQYGDAYPMARTWKIEKDGKTLKNDSILNCQEVGVYRVTATAADRKVYSREIYMTPQMDNLALRKTVTASSEENVGLLAKFATDGDLSTRWSSRSADDEWMAVDLGKRVFVNSVCIHWEAAYATRYTVEISDDGKVWQEAADCNGNGGEETVEIGREARHIRISGKGRATSYGYSIWELEVFGIDPEKNPADLMGIAIESPSDLLKEGTPVVLKAVGYNGRGEKTDLADVEWTVASGDGTIAPDGTYCPAGYGRKTVTVAASGKTASREFIVEEQVCPRSASVYPRKAALALGETQTFTLEAFDQFSTPCGGDGFVFSCPSAPDLMKEHVFTAARKGIYEVVAANGDVRASATVSVGDFSDVNLALGKRAYATSFENAQTVPENVNDGDLSTRWGSAFEDKQSVTVDLGADYVLNRVDLHWNAGAYSTLYRIEVSTDEDNWTSLGEFTNASGSLHSHKFAPAVGRYVRIFCEKRANIYGSCLDELEVYGTALYDNPYPVEMTVAGGSEVVAYVGEPKKMEVVLTDQYGIDCSDSYTVDWVIEGGCAEISADGVVTPLIEGESRVTARCGNLSAEIVLHVKAAKAVAGVVVETLYTEVEVGSEVELKASAVDQYGQTLPDEPVAWSDPAVGGRFVASAEGDYLLTASSHGFKAEATVHVIAALTENIALKKTVTASSGEGSASSANDGNDGTRWIASSAGENVEWLEIDLGAFYHLLRSSIVWERASAADYDIEVSSDRVKWQTLAGRRGLEDAGGTRVDEERVDGLGRYVRVRCLRPATQWAYSIFEWKLYGRRMEAGEPCRLELDVPTTLKTDETALFVATATDCNGDVVADAPLWWSATGGVVTQNGVYRSELPGVYRVKAVSGLATAEAQLTVAGETSGAVGIEMLRPVFRMVDGNVLVVEAAFGTIRVLDLSGRPMAVYKHVVEGTFRRRLDLPDGVYLVEVQSSSCNVVGKVAVYH